MLNKRTKRNKEKNNKGLGNPIKQIIYAFTIILTFIYIAYRICFTLPLHLGVVGLICSIIVLLLEIWESADFFIYYINILSVNKSAPKIPVITDMNVFPEVDVLIATINEGENLLRNTIEACKNMNYPDKSKVHIYVCDDGNRANIKNLAENLNGSIIKLGPTSKT